MYNKRKFSHTQSQTNKRRPEHHCCPRKTSDLHNCGVLDFKVHVIWTVSNVEICVECQTFVMLIFFNCGQVLQFWWQSRYYKGALTQKRWFLVICTTFRSDFFVSWKNQNKHSALNLSFDALSKWYEPDITHPLEVLESPFSWILDFWPHQSGLSKYFLCVIVCYLLRYQWYFVKCCKKKINWD